MNSQDAIPDRPESGSASASANPASLPELLLHWAPGGIFSYSAEEDEQFAFVSENMLAFLGYTRREFTEKFRNRFSLMVWHEDRERVLREIAEQISRGPFDTCEYRIEKKDGSLVWVHDEGHIRADETGKRWFYVVIVDISDSIRAREKERAQFRQAIRTVLNANPEALCAFQLNLTRNECRESHGASDYIRRLLQADTVDAMFAQAAANLPDKAERAEFARVFDRHALLAAFEAGQTGVRMDYRHRNESGRTIWVRAFLTMLKNPGTGDTEAAVYSVDVTREKQREEILRVLTGVEYDFIALLHLDQGTVEAFYLGQALPRAYRERLPAPGTVCSLDVFRAEAAEKWLVPEDREKYRRCSDPAVYRPVMDAAGRFEFVLRERFPDAPGEVMHRRFQHYYLGGDRDTILVIESDVTEAARRQQRELERVRAEAQRVKDILDSITTGICVLHMPDPDHLRISYVNRQMYRLLGFRPAENDVEGMAGVPERLIADYTENAFSGVHPDDLERVKKAFRDNFNSPAFVVDNYRTQGSGGRYCWIKEEVCLREVTPEYKVFYATYRDVSEEVRLNAELNDRLEREKALRRQATAANEAKSDFLSRMSHDIRTPLNGIIGMTRLAGEQDNPPRTADCLAKIDTSSRFLLGLINDILDMSKAESGKIELYPEPYLMADFDCYLDSVIRPLCEGKHQTFTAETHAVETVVPIVDILRYNQVIFNLLSNAVKYTPEGGTISLCVSNELIPGHRERITAVIRDNGVGMSPEFQQMLFEPFTQESRSDTSEHRGSGLGLAIVKRMVDLMGGTITVESRRGKGTVFTVTADFDYIEADQATWHPGGNAAPTDPEALAGRHILLCEDHPLNQEIARALLEEKKMLVTVAEDGRKGLERFLASTEGFYDCILMDIRMPVMDGYETTRLLRALPRADAESVPIVAMTADAFENDVRKCLDAGMNAHIPKPVDPDMLYQTLCRVIPRR